MLGVSASMGMADHGSNMKRKSVPDLVRISGTEVNMSKIAFVFPGQGAQAVGMGKDVYDNSAVAKEVFDKASEAVELDLKALCFEENNDINITEYTQVCLLTTSVAIMEELKTRGVKADVAAGLSGSQAWYLHAGRGTGW